MDIALLFRNDRYETDIALNGPDLQQDHDLETAIIISLFTDRRANSDDVVESDDRRGHWSDTYSEIPNDKLGSRLWLLSREKQTQDVINRARAYCVEALQWLLDDAVAEQVNIEVGAVRMGVLGIKVEVVRPTGINNFNFDYAWRQL